MDLPSGVLNCSVKIVSKGRFMLNCVETAKLYGLWHCFDMLLHPASMILLSVTCKHDFRSPLAHSQHLKPISCNDSGLWCCFYQSHGHVWLLLILSILSIAVHPVNRQRILHWTSWDSVVLAIHETIVYPPAFLESTIAISLCLCVGSLPQCLQAALSKLVYRSKQML